MENGRRFPELPKFSVRWAPVYLEPVMGSGERVTIAVAAIAEQGESVVLPILDSERAQCLFGAGATAFLSVVDLCVQDLRFCLKKGMVLDEWVAPLDGASIGIPRPLRAMDMTAALRLAVQKSAFLGNLALFMGDEEDENVADAAPDKWTQQIECVLRARRPDLLARMRGQFHVTDKARPTRIDFLGLRYAANFARIVPGSRSFSGYIKSAKVKLWDLDTLRMASSRPVMNPDIRSAGQLHVAYELLLWRPKSDDPAYSDRDIQRLEEAVLEIEYEGDRKGLRVVSFTGEEQAGKAADRIIRMEAA